MSNTGKTNRRPRSRTHLIAFGYVIQTEPEDRVSGLPGKYAKYNRLQERTISLANAHFFDDKRDAIHALQFVSPCGQSIFEDGFPRVMFAEQFDKIRQVRT